MRLIGDPSGGIVRKWFQSFFVLNHERISWVSIEIYYHDNFVFGHFFMFLTSIVAHFCVLCRQTARSLWGVESWYVVHMLAYALELNTAICQIAYSIWLGARRITRIGLKIMG